MLVLVRQYSVSPGPKYNHIALDGLSKTFSDKVIYSSPPNFAQENFGKRKLDSKNTYYYGLLLRSFSYIKPWLEFTLPISHIVSTGL